MSAACEFDCPDDEAESNLVERRFFAVLAALETVQGECKVLERVVGLAEESWRQSRGRLIELERLRDALGRQLTPTPLAVHAEQSAA